LRKAEAAALAPSEAEARVATPETGIEQAPAAQRAPGAEAPPLKNAVALARHLLGRLRLGWNASGLWSAAAVSVSDAAEVEAIEGELIFRLRGIERAALLRAGELAPGDASRLEQLCLSLRAMAE
jgi:hypothetical protein